MHEERTVSKTFLCKQIDNALWICIPKRPPQLCRNQHTTYQKIQLQYPKKVNLEDAERQPHAIEFQIQDHCHHAGNTLALEISQLDDNDASSPAEALRQVCGPLDSVTAQAVRPHSLRARFGVSKIQNAVHCTDLEEDTEMEIGKTFSIL